MTDAGFACPVCDHRELHHLTDVGRGGRPAKFWSCLQCGSVLQDPAFSRNWSSDAYSSGAYAHDNMGAPPGRLFKLQRGDGRERVRFVRKAGAVGPLLEIGSSCGSFAAAAVEAGFQVTACEPDPTNSAFIGETLKVPVHRGGWESLPAAPPFGAICAFHFFEHLDRPLAFLDFARQRLAPDGLLILETPDAANPWTDRPDWTDWFDLGHVITYTGPALAHMLGRGGFQVVRLDTRLQLRLVAKVSGASDRILMWGLAGEVTRTAFGNYRRHHGFRRRLRRLGRGLSWPWRKVGSLFGAVL